MCVVNCHLFELMFINCIVVIFYFLLKFTLVCDVLQFYYYYYYYDRNYMLAQMKNFSNWQGCPSIGPYGKDLAVAFPKANVEHFCQYIAFVL